MSILNFFKYVALIVEPAQENKEKKKLLKKLYSEKKEHKKMKKKKLNLHEQIEMMRNLNEIIPEENCEDK